MRKIVSGSNQGRNRRCETVRRRKAKSVDAIKDSILLEHTTSDKPASPPLSKLLPSSEERIAFKMPSDVKYLDGVLDYINERMLKLGIVKADDSEVLIALDEAIVNAIKHGNKCDPRKAVHIVAELGAGGARFTITDEGPGFVKDNVPDPTDPSRLLEPSGRGLLLINHIMDEVCYNKAGNQVQMFKRTAQEFAFRARSSKKDRGVGKKHR